MNEIESLYKYLSNTKYSNREKNKISLNIETIELKYPAERDFYIEVAKYYLLQDNKESIKNLEKYVAKGGDNEEVKLLLLKLYKQEKQLKDAKEFIKNLKKTNEVVIEELNLAIEMKDKLWIKEIGKEIKDRDIEISENEIKEICRIYEEEKEYAEEEYYINKYENKYNLSNIKCKYYEKQGYIEQALKEFIKNIDTDNNKNEFIRIINKNIDTYIRKTKDVKYIIDCLCELIEKDDTDTDSIRTLSLILLVRNPKGEEKKDIVTILMRYSENSKKLRAGNIFLNEAEILEKKTILKSKPRELAITLTMKCNLRCIMCENGYDHQYEIDEKTYEYLVKIMPYLEKIELKGGEVFLYKNFKELLMLANKYNVNQVILTNGLLLNKEIISFLSKNRVFLSISIDAADKEMYEKIRSGGKFEKLLENLEILKNLKNKNKNFKYSMSSVLMSVNYDKVSELVDFAKFYKFDFISFLKCIEYPQGDKSLLLTQEQMYEIYKQVDKETKKLKESVNDFKIKLDIPFVLYHGNN